jgi:hypothetical protein
MSTTSASAESQEIMTLDTGTYSRFPSRLLPLVPERTPRIWTIINNILAASGCFLILDLCYANWGIPDDDPTEERPFARAFFLLWEFAACFFWTAESGLSACYQHWYLRQPLAWHTNFELVIAGYFLMSTFQMLWEWNLLEYDMDTIWDIALDTSCYMYLAIRSCKRIADDTGTRGDDGDSSNQQAAMLPEDLETEGSYQMMSIHNGAFTEAD